MRDKVNISLRLEHVIQVYYHYTLVILIIILTLSQRTINKLYTLNFYIHQDLKPLLKSHHRKAASKFHRFQGSIIKSPKIQ